jgi:hypothetical protein
MLVAKDQSSCQCRPMSVFPKKPLDSPTHQKNDRFLREKTPAKAGKQTDGSEKNRQIK